MRLEVLLPTEVLVDEHVSRVITEAENGSFCLLPRHVDFVSALVPGVLTFYDDLGGERFVAIDHAILVKCGATVSVSTVNAVLGAELGILETLVEERFIDLGEQEKRARTALARLEAGTLRGFRELQEQVRG